MQAVPIRVLLIEDESADAEFVKRSVDPRLPRSLRAVACQRMTQACPHLGDGNFDVLLLDLGLPEFCDLEALKESRRINREIPIVVLTGLRNEKMAMDALEHGTKTTW